MAQNRFASAARPSRCDLRRVAPFCRESNCLFSTMSARPSKSPARQRAVGAGGSSASSGRKLRMLDDVLLCLSSIPSIWRLWLLTTGYHVYFEAFANPPPPKSSLLSSLLFTPPPPPHQPPSTGIWLLLLLPLLLHAGFLYQFGAHPLEMGRRQRWVFNRRDDLASLILTAVPALRATHIRFFTFWFIWVIGALLYHFRIFVLSFIVAHWKLHWMKKIEQWNVFVKTQSVGRVQDEASALRDADERARKTPANLKLTSLRHKLFVPPDDSNHEVKTARAMFSWIVANIKFDRNQSVVGNVRPGQSAQEVYGARKAVCAGYANLYAELARGAGLKCLIVCDAAHAWNVVRANGEWFFVDASHNDWRSSARLPDWTPPTHKGAKRAFHCASWFYWTSAPQLR